MPTGTGGQNTLSITYLNSVDKDKLMITYAEVIDMVQKDAISVQLKNQDIQGEVVRGGSVIVRRLSTAVSKSYGTARAAAHGDKLQNNGVEVKIDTDKEIVEEVEKKDIDRYGVPALMDKRKRNQAMAMARDLDRAFFVAAQTAASTVDVTSEPTLVGKVELLIQNLETATGNNVDGVNREDMVLTLSPYWYGQLRNYLDTLANPSDGGVRPETFHGVRVMSSTRQGVDALLMYRGAVAQPVAVDPYSMEKINLSNAFAVELFYSYGTKAVMPELIRKAGLDAGGNISV